MQPTILTSAICPTCHQATLPEYYFCPNCGTALRSAPLDVSTGAQVKLYLFSIVLPMIGFIFVTRWKGNTYYKSEDSNTKQIGVIAWSLLALSTIFVIWYAVVWTQNYIQATVESINTDFSGI